MVIIQNADTPSTVCEQQNDPPLGRYQVPQHIEGARLFDQACFDLKLVDIATPFCPLKTRSNAVQHPSVIVSLIRNAWQSHSTMLDLMKLRSTVASEQEVFGFGKSTAYATLSEPEIKWMPMIEATAMQVTDNVFPPGTPLFVVVDDTLVDRCYCRNHNLELGSTQYDHNKHRWIMGYTMLLITITDGKTSVPITFRLVGATDPDDLPENARTKRAKRTIQEHQPTENKHVDGRTCAGKLRKDATRKKPELLVEIVKHLTKKGLNVQGILMDSWFTCPSMIANLDALDMPVIGMLKNGNTRYYDRETGEAFDVKEVTESLKQRLERGEKLEDIPLVKHAFSRKEIVHTTADGKKIKEVVYTPVKIVWSRNWARDSAKNKPFVALITTNIDLTDEEVVALYMYRWSIETFIKILKGSFGLYRGFHTRNFESNVASISLILIRYLVVLYINKQFMPEANFAETLKALHPNATELNELIEEFYQENVKLKALNERLWAENAQLKAEKSQLEAENTKLEAANTQLEAETAHLKAKIAQFEADFVRFKANHYLLQADYALLAADNNQLKAELQRRRNSPPFREFDCTEGEARSGLDHEQASPTASLRSNPICRLYFKKHKHR